jgi:hypothetical protein
MSKTEIMKDRERVAYVGEWVSVPFYGDCSSSQAPLASLALILKKHGRYTLT